MMIDPQSADRYKLSFTSGALLESEALVAAPLYLRARDWSKVRELIEKENLLQARTCSSGSRRARATVQRLGVLSDDEIHLLVDASSTERGHLLWVAACRQYKLIGEFAEEVLRERFLTLAGRITYEEYDSFYRSKALWHDELNKVAESSYSKLRQILFRMMIEAELLTNQGHIEPALLSPRVAACLENRTPSDIRFFPTRVA
jgi:hypothetical protein